MLVCVCVIGFVRKCSCNHVMYVNVAMFRLRALRCSSAMSLEMVVKMKLQSFRSEIKRNIGKRMQVVRVSEIKIKKESSISDSLFRSFPFSDWFLFQIQNKK